MSDKDLITLRDSYARYIQENPTEVVKQIQSILEIIAGYMPSISKKMVCKIAHDVLTYNYQERMETSLPLPFDSMGNDITGNLS